MDSPFRNIQPKWLVLVYGIYLVDRSLMGLFDSGTAYKLLFGGQYQQERIAAFLPRGFSEFWPFHLPFSYLVLSFMHPILFAIASVEVAKRKFPFALYSVIQILFSISIVVIAVTNIIDVVVTFGIRSAIHIQSRELLKNLTAVISSPLICGISIYWWRRPIRLWEQDQ